MADYPMRPSVYAVCKPESNVPLWKQPNTLRKKKPNQQSFMRHNWDQRNYCNSEIYSTSF